MAIRMSGLSSGLDTEAIVGALMSAQSLKKTKISNAKTKLEWKQDKWKDLNTKLYKFYTEQASKMQMQSAFMTKKASISDPTVAKVNATTKAANGSYTMEVKNIATSQYLTGGKLANAKSASQKMTDIDSSLLNSEINIKVGDKESKFVVTADTTINDFTGALRDAGLNASFDEKQQRLFISSKESGLDNAFSITSSKISDSQVQTTADLKNAVGYNAMSKENKAIVDKALETLKSSGVGTQDYNDALDSLNKAKSDTEATKFYSAKVYAEKYDANKSAAQSALESNYYDKAEDGTLTVKDSLKEQYKTQYEALTDGDKKMVLAQMGKDPEVDSLTEDEYIEFSAKKAYDDAVNKKADGDTMNEVSKAISSPEGKVAIEAISRTGVATGDLLELKTDPTDATTFSTAAKETALAKYYNYGNDASPTPITGFEGTENGGSSAIATAAANYANVTDRYDAGAGSALSKLGLGEIVSDASGVSLNGSRVDGSANLASGMALIAASDSEIVLNGATLTSGSSTVSANGLNIDLTGKTRPGETVTFSVSNDTDAVYNSIKNMLKEYNSLIKEMNELYSAPSAKGYEPLTKDEKKAMSEDDIKLYEDKIKGASLRSDTTLNSIIQSMKSAMQSQVEYNGKNYSLASFGIMTSRDYTEGGQYHIYGDADDSVYADKTDKLRDALENDTEAVVNVLSKVFGNLRSNMNDKMASSKVSSALTFYNDIKMKNDTKSYTDELKSWEEKLEDMEDAYYKKFTTMEKAMAKLQSQQSSMGMLFGN